MSETVVSRGLGQQPGVVRREVEIAAAHDVLADDLAVPLSRAAPSPRKTMSNTLTEHAEFHAARALARSPR